MREVLRERGQPEEAPGLPPRDDQPAGLLPEDVALQCLYCRLHPRERSVSTYSFTIWEFCGINSDIFINLLVLKTSLFGNFFAILGGLEFSVGEKFV